MNGPFVERQGLQRLRHTCIENRKSNVHDGGDDTRVDSKCWVTSLLVTISRRRTVLRCFHVIMCTFREQKYLSHRLPSHLKFFLRRRRRRLLLFFSPPSPFPSSPFPSSPLPIMGTWMDVPDNENIEDGSCTGC